MNTQTQTLYKVKKTKSGSDEISLQETRVIFLRNIIEKWEHREMHCRYFTREYSAALS